MMVFLISERRTITYICSHRFQLEIFFFFFFCFVLFCFGNDFSSESVLFGTYVNVILEIARLSYLLSY